MKKKILIVDDENIILEPISEKFRDEGFEVETACDGEEGLKKALEFLPEVILLDVMMPKMTGLEMLEKLREDEKGKDMKVIVLTNANEVEKVEEAAKSGASEYLVKVEWSLENLVKKVKSKFEVEE